MTNQEARQIIKGNNLNEAKSEYRRLCKIYHPDINPNGLEMMKLINLAYHTILENDNFNDSNEASTLDILKEYENILNATKNLAGIKVELCGTWLWFSGETKPHKETLKSLGCYWASKKLMWYYHSGEYHSRSRGIDMNTIRKTYGSVDLTEQKKSYQGLRG